MSMKVGMVDLKKQHSLMRDEIFQALDKVMDESMFVQGRFVREFESLLSGYLKTDYCLGCNSGTDALFIALKALKLKPGDQVIIPANGYAAAAEAVIRCGGRPVFSPFNTETFALEAENIEHLITEKTVGVIAVHLYGQVSPLDDFRRLKDDYGLWVLEDFAQAVGSRWWSDEKGEYIMAGAFGDISATSFYPTKNLGALGDSGACVTNNYKYFQWMKIFADHGQSEKDYHAISGINSRMDTFQAAVLKAKLNFLDEFIEARRRNAVKYRELIKSNGMFELPYEHPQSFHTYHQFVLRFNTNQRDEFREYLKKNGVATQIHYPILLVDQPAFRKYVNQNESFDEYSCLVDRIVSIPVHAELTEKQTNYVVEVINSFCK
ncbi:DegT/DnrJ/EryC1/StrS family aminotransferase [Marinigracilibium pacificum]|uniref:DegT/DnrJ/EryC1/StrS family aminotransferase n=1 Tax=Marinigracilibium pacificum TaxID=2729599 RepID=A0A848J092_9BACT|nr:DegT/DnrJ/EryC1/StrS family aminotransferase [Marinigracilibium pacificum]NMM48798.1 DegT/DnrJ/EryC1/StrS family aminotransferase [Marinigracilibium pacificum]